MQPCRSGYIEPAALSDLLGDDVALVSIMVANNETGVVQPIRELAAAAHTVGACSTPMPSRGICTFRSMSPSWASMP